MEVKILKELGIISCFRHTCEMEKSLYRNHNISYSEYENKLENKLKVEKKREKDYAEGLEILSVNRMVIR